LILRMVRGRVLPGRHHALRAGLLESLSQMRNLDGVLHVSVGLRAVPEGNEFALITTWATPDATVAAFGPNVDRIALIGGVTEHLDVRTVAHFELDESVLIQHDARRSILRVAIGSIELGSDAEIQQELRRRIPELGPEVVEAYVGRRISDRMVEVAFITLWSRPPSDRLLEEPVFLDVAERYASYAIEVYDEVYCC
jgi:hypothetical protein